MATVTVRITDEKHARLKELAKTQRLSLNRLFDELATIALVEHDAATRFRLRAKRGSAKRGLELLDALDRREPLR